jgi:hypothetical protein
VIEPVPPLVVMVCVDGVGPATENVNVPFPPAVFFVISRLPFAVLAKAAAGLVPPTGTVTVFVRPDVFVQPAGGVVSVTVYAPAVTENVIAPDPPLVVMNFVEELGPATENVNVPSPPVVFFVISRPPVIAFAKVAGGLVPPSGTVTICVAPDVFVQPVGGVLSVTV